MDILQWMNEIICVDLQTYLDQLKVKKAKETKNTQDMDRFPHTLFQLTTAECEKF